MPRPPIHLITTPKAWAVYIAPVRLEIVETMRMIAPCSIAEIAAAIDRPADTLYRHIEKLRKIGAVVEAGVRRSGRRFEQVFDLAGDDFRLGLRDLSPRTTNKMFDLSAQSIAKLFSRTARDATAAEQIVYEPTKRNASVKFEQAWLTQAEFEELRGMFVALKEFMDARKLRREGRLYFVAFAAIPVHRKRGARIAATRVSAASSTAAPAPPSAKTSVALGSRSSAKVPQHRAQAEVAAPHPSPERKPRRKT